MICYQYQADRARRAVRGTDEQVRTAEQPAAAEPSRSSPRPHHHRRRPTPDELCRGLDAINDPADLRISGR